MRGPMKQTVAQGVRAAVQPARTALTTRGGTPTTTEGPPQRAAASTMAARAEEEEVNIRDVYAPALHAALSTTPGTPEPYVRKYSLLKEQKEVPMDGNSVAAYVAYGLSETSFIYPISPATSMGELMDSQAASGKLNALGQTVEVQMMQSEGGAAGALHGAVASGTLASTFTASQGLLLMIPNLYLLAGELAPAVLHISARTVSKHALSIFNDHSDVMACRQTGMAMLCATSVQEVMDLGVVAHIASIRARLPFMHFFDGLRTSAEICKIKEIPYSAMRDLIPQEELQTNLRNLALNPNHPVIRGTGQRPDIFFQGSLASERFHQAGSGIVQAVMDEVAQITGRQYHLFDYVGHPEADRVVVIMGSGAETVEEVVEYMNANREKVGVLKVRLYRPWSPKAFLAALPSTAKKIAVLDRTREEGAQANPLHLDVASTILEAGQMRQVIGGTYGLASKEFTPGMAQAVFHELNKGEDAKSRFVVGVEDDICHTSLDYSDDISVVAEGTKQCMFWGLGGDGTIGANKAAIKTLAINAGMEAQGFFTYDSHKENGATISHLRFGPNPIKSRYLITNNADYIACHHPSYVKKFDLLAAIKPGGILLVNCPWDTVADVEKNFPVRLRQQIVANDIQLFVIPATQVALQIGLGGRINTLMQACFYHLSGVLPVDQAISLLKKNITEMYSKKGPEVVELNHKAVDAAKANFKKIEYPQSWAEGDPTIGVRKLKEHTNVPTTTNEVIDDFVENIMDPVLALEGDKLPVSKFVPGGFMPAGTCMHEERSLAPEVPVWEADKCTQCNYCAIVCPHAVVRPFLLDRNEVKAAPEGFETRRATGGAEFAGLNYSIQLAVADCTGCAVCVEACPDDALAMEPFENVIGQLPNWDYAVNLPPRNPMDKFTVKGSQFETPLLEFSGACPGCGETPYVKLLTQLFGDRMVIANASGCSSVWGGTATTNPYTINTDGKGPAWGRSLFEDNAEYGYGMYLATRQRRRRAQNLAQAAIDNPPKGMSETLRNALENYMKYADDYDKQYKWVTQIEKLLPKEQETIPELTELYMGMDMLRWQSQWIIGGDGWAYDIGYGGLDHVVSKGENINIMVLDTEMYSNTGGQVSKATQKSAVLKFAQKGKPDMKKDLGAMVMMYGDVYVAQIAVGANMNQSVQALKEAESYPGTSLIICYSPCIDWGIPDMRYMMNSMKNAVDSGYWKLYRFDPRLPAKGQMPLQLDSARIKTSVEDYMLQENRFKQLRRADRERAEAFFASVGGKLRGDHESFKRQSLEDMDLLDYLKGLLGEGTSGEKALVLFASETGTAQELGKVFSSELKRRGIRARAMAMDDYDIESLPSEKLVLVVAATCGQGEFPENSRGFWKSLQDPSLPSDYLAETTFASFALGDTAYVYYNKVGKDIDSRMAELGAKRIVDIGMGNDKDDEKWETAWNEWVPNLWTELGTPPPPQELPVPTYIVNTVERSATTLQPESEMIVTPGAKVIPMVTSELLCPEDYDRDIRHYEFNLKDTGMMYNLGDSLGVYAWAHAGEVTEFLEWYGLKADDILTVEDPSDGGKFPEVMTALQCFQQVVDIFGRPGRRFYEMLALVANETEKAEIEHLLSKEGQDDYKEMMKDTPNYADLMMKWPSAKPSLEYLLEWVPAIKPRLYSIASSPEADGESLHLCVVNEDWVSSSGRERYGLCTRHMRLQEDPKTGGSSPIVARVNGASFTVPANHTQPMIMVALGTGIAPIRAVIRERMHHHYTTGEAVGEMGLFFGIRHRATEYSYGEEWDKLHEDGFITVLGNAFSRDQAHKIYVQDRLAENQQTIYDWIVKQNGYYLLCGPSGPPCAASRQALVDAIATCGASEGWTQEKADQYITEMQISGRYNEEVW